MNILTFDIEDWYNCDFISGDFDWDKHEVRIFFRLFPYWLIRHWAKDVNYMMTYFHPRDFDTGQPVVRRFKSYVGIKGAFRKFQRLLDNFEFVNVAQADKLIDWEKTPVLRLKELSHL